MATTAVKVTQKPDVPEVPVEVFAQAIVDIAAAMRRIEGGRLNRAGLVVLLHDRTKVPRRDINYVLNGLLSLERTYVKASAQPKAQPR